MKGQVMELTELTNNIKGLLRDRQVTLISSYPPWQSPETRSHELINAAFEGLLRPYSAPEGFSAGDVMVWDGRTTITTTAAPGKLKTAEEFQCEGAHAERTRILSLLNDLRPYDEPYSRREWEIERKGAKDMHAKIVKAIEGLK